MTSSLLIVFSIDLADFENLKLFNNNLSFNYFQTLLVRKNQKKNEKI